MRAANPFITHVIGSLREAEVGWQTVDTIKLHFRFRCPGAVNEVKFGGQITKVLATQVMERGKLWQRRGRQIRLCKGLPGR